MKRKIVLFACETTAVRYYTRQIKDFFGELLELESCQVNAGEAVNGGEIPEAELYVASTSDAIPAGADFLKEENRIVHIGRTFFKEKTKILTELPAGAKVLYFDYSDIMAAETLAILNNINKKLRFIYCASPAELRLHHDAAAVIVISDEEADRPEGATSIGWYAVSPETYIEIAQHLDILDEELSQKIYSYAQKVHVVTPGLFEVVNGKWALEDVWNTVIDMVSEGIVLVDDGGRVLRCNHHAETQKIFVAEAENRVVCPQIQALLRSGRNFLNEVIDFENAERTLLLTSRQIITIGKEKWRLLLLKDAADVSMAERTLRVQQRKKQFSARYTFDDIITENAAMKKLIAISRRIAASDVSVLITGKSGTGKEMFAQSIHNASGRARMPFVAVNCAAIPDHLLESELFGYEEGAFTGARRGGKKGLLELAHGGTIFFDEVGEMPLTIQAKLLRVLQEREVIHVGGETLIPINIRVLAASNENFEELMEEKKFREDLFYRLSAVQLEILPLSQRREDIPLLARRFLREMSGQTMSPELLAYMKELPWGGNVRELRNCVEYMVALGEEVLTVDDLPAGQKKRAQRRDRKESFHALDVLLQEEREAAEEILKALELKPLGRRSLTAVLNQRGIRISEYRIRKLLQFLSEQNLIRIQPGRHGIELNREKT